MRTLAILAAAMALAACNEIPQEPGKAYAGKEDSKPYAGDTFKGDKDKYEKALAARAQSQNEYVRNIERARQLSEAAKAK